MLIHVLGCSGSIAAGSRTTAFLVDQDILIDAGTGVGDLTLEQMAAIDHIFVSHSHLDHVLSIGLLADSVTRKRSAERRPPVRVHALAPTLQALRTHIFNGVIWPDFTRLPTAQEPVLEFAAVEVGQVIQIGTRRIEVLPAAHTVPAVGYAVESTTAGSRGAWVFSGDTGPNAALWERLRQMRLATLVIETAFRDDELELAQISRHLCPSLLAQELRNLPAPAEVLITHIKPGEVDAVMSEIAAQNGQHRISALVSGQVIDLG